MTGEELRRQVPAIDGASSKLTVARMDYLRAQVAYREAVADAVAGGMSQGEVARILGIGQAAVSRMVKRAGRGDGALPIDNP